MTITGRDVLQRTQGVSTGARYGGHAPNTMVGSRASVSHPSEFVTVHHVARLFDVTDRTVRRWCEEGKLAFVQPGRAIRIRRASVEALIHPADVNAA